MVYSIGQTFYNMATREIKTSKDILSVFAGCTALTTTALGILAALRYVAINACNRAGFTSLAMRLSLPVLTNPWFVLAIAIGIPALNVLIRALKTKGLEKRTSKKNEF